MPLSWLFGIPFHGFFDPRFIYALPLFASPSLTLIMAMVTVLAVTVLMARNALNY
jgi:hypothetical protein